MGPMIVFRAGAGSASGVMLDEVLVVVVVVVVVVAAAFVRAGAEQQWCAGPGCWPRMLAAAAALGGGKRIPSRGSDRHAVPRQRASSSRTRSLRAIVLTAGRQHARSV